MINLLPPAIKEQITYSKRNRIVMHYFWIVGLTVMLLAVVFASTLYYLNKKLEAAKADKAAKLSEISTYKGLQDSVVNLNSRISTIKKIQSGQAKFSGLLADLAKSMPSGAALTTITLTGDDKKPVSVSALADSYKTAVGLRDTLAASSRIMAADIQSVSNTKDGYRVEILLSFKPGLAK